MKKILIRADGGRGIGMGHVQRMLTLAKELRKNNKVFFVCRRGVDKQYDVGIKKIQDEGFEVIIINNDNLIDEIKNVQKSIGADMLFTDSYDVNEEYFDKLAGCFYKTGYMDDINSMRINTDLIINQNIGSELLLYNHSPNNNTKLLLGSKYVLLRDEFKVNGDSRLEKDRIMITVGGSDDYFLTLKIINLLQDVKCTLNVVVGGAFTNELIEKLEEQACKNDNIILYKNCIMSEVMKKSNMAVSSCGSTLYELGAMRIPAIGIVVADNQKQIALNMDKAGVIINTERLIYENSEKFKSIFKEFFSDICLREKMKINAKEVLSINGAEIAAEEIRNLLQ